MHDLQTENAVAAALAVKGLAEREIAGHPYIVTDEGQSAESLEWLLPTPLRRQAEAHFSETASFIRYVDRFRSPNVLVTADADTHSAAAVLDYHGDGPEGVASWRDHKATLKLGLSPEWLTWTQADKRQFNQTDFAEFLEQNLADIADPDGAKLQEAVLKMQVNRNVRVASAANLDTGEIAFTYEDLDNKQKGTAKLPRRLVLGLPVYRHGARYRLEAALRYRLQDGKLSFFYVLQRPDKLTEDAFDGVLEEIEKGLGERPLLGTAR